MKLIFTLTLSVGLLTGSLKTYSEDRHSQLQQLHNNSIDIKMLSSSLFTAGGVIADGNRVVFDQQYSNAVDGNDAIKLMNPGENFGLSRDNQILAIEARQPIAAGDTLFYNLSHLAIQAYKLDIVPQNLGAFTVNCELIDRYLNTRQQISLTDSNHLSFEVTADPASKAAGRLLVVFNITPAPVATVEFINSTAMVDGKNIRLTWQVEHELNVAHYEIERGETKDQLLTLSSVATVYDNEHGGTYQFTDIAALHADNFYRIRAIDKKGSSIFSNTIKVSMPVLHTSIMNIYPNPVINRSFQLQLHGMLPGKYLVKLTNSFGQQVYSTTINVNGNDFTQTVTPEGNFEKGNYNLSVWSGNGIIVTGKIIVQ